MHASFPRPTAPRTRAQLDGRSALQLLDELPSGVWICDATGLVLYANAPSSRWFPDAISLDAALAGTRMLVPFKGWSAELARILSSDDERIFEYVLVRGAHASVAATQRTPRLFRLRGRRWDHAVDPATMAIVFWIDPISDEDAPHDPLGVTERLASLGKLAARVAHELNNPLDGILRYVNLALRIVDGRGEDKLRSYLSESRTGLMRMTQILGELLDYSRQTDASDDVVDVNEVIDQALRSYNAAAESAGVVVTSNFRFARMPCVRGSRLFQILGNLIRNAIDAMPGGGRLTVTSAIVDDQVVIEVADTGVGLPLDLEKVFEPFFTTKPPGKGTGLGLAISRDYVREMEGTITASHGVDGGAVFTVRIPLVSLDGPAA